ncbi:class I SAM-dependent methyltransferase [Shewanella morhuae]|uniref:class I SAM-dependent methyltransferase n=1 Tax=Shewanella morhuae TaxID=365591 RepID=UPI001BC72F6D|nr:class I SAM-dependent methyltransferase [Shewanella morhuae]GIU10485.1 type 11 methyltransferase [Shewanella morhuae]
MKLNPFEKKLVQHPLRFWLQNHVEARLLTSMMPKPMPCCERALEIGCGFGNGIQLIREHFGAGHITAIDIDAEMVAAAQSRWQARPQGIKGLSFSVADATRLPFTDSQFDIVFDFAVFHHIPDWQTAIKEVERVIKPNGYFVVEDLHRAAICNPLSRRLFEHPQQHRFNHSELLTVMRQTGFKIVCDRNVFNLAGIVLAQKVSG